MASCNPVSGSISAASASRSTAGPDVLPRDHEQRRGDAERADGDHPGLDHPGDLGLQRERGPVADGDITTSCTITPGRLKK